MTEKAQPDGASKTQDGCPTERAVLQRFWRKFSAKISSNRDAALAQSGSDWWKGYAAACRDLNVEMARLKDAQE